MFFGDNERKKEKKFNETKIKLNEIKVKFKFIFKLLPRNQKSKKYKKIKNTELS